MWSRTFSEAWVVTARAMTDVDYSSFSESDDGMEVDYTPMDVEIPAAPTYVPAAPTYEYENRDRASSRAPTRPTSDAGSVALPTWPLAQ